MAEGKHFRLDVKGLFSPLAHLKAIQVVNKMDPGDTLCIEHIDPESIADLMTILKKYPLEFTGPEKQDGWYLLQLTKKK
ncbi:MAG: sulfurtransferase TusA family protein [Desulfovermiculus sp.]|nr:sulfurtransferase TusA family protein [Desulfovermiculus sp.]